MDSLGFTETKEFLPLYFEIEREYTKKCGPTIVLCQCGSFYEIYGKDDNGNAHIASKLLNFQLTRRTKKEPLSDTNPWLIGFPSLSLMKQLPILIESNYTVVRVDQELNNPNIRKVAQVYSKGTIDSTQSDSNNYLCIIVASFENKMYSYGISKIDLTTGDVIISETHFYDNIHEAFEYIHTKVESILPNELVIFTDADESVITKFKKLFVRKPNVQPIKSECIDIIYQNEFLHRVYNVNIQESPIEYLNLERYKWGTLALIHSFEFIKFHNQKLLSNLKVPFIEHNDQYLCLVNSPLYQLGICAHKTEETSLFSIINHTSTGMGKRLLYNQITNPYIKIDKILPILEDVESMVNYKLVEKHLKNIFDIERLSQKIRNQKINPHELFNYISSLEDIITLLSQYPKYNDTYTKVIELKSNLDSNINLQKIQYSYDVKENIFLPTINKKLDDIQQNINSLESEINKECYKISTEQIKAKDNVLKLEGNSKTGYNLSTTLNRSKMIDTNKYKVIKENKKAYVSSNKLVEKLDKLCGYQNEIQPLAVEEYNNYLDSLWTKYGETMISMASIIGYIDTIKSRRKCAELNNHCKPVLHDAEKSYFKAKNLRHPVVEYLDQDTMYVGNDIDISDKGMLLFGVNGSGKSCLMKSIGIAIILAQSGHYVPADSVEIGIYHKLFARISGEDNIYKGQSSFAVEANELRHILKESNQRSIVLGDEVCRGTEDKSALSLVSATIITLIKKDASFIFATHLHNLPKQLEPYIENVHINHLSVTFQGDDIVYDRKLNIGQGDTLYGLEIAEHIINEEEFITIAKQIRHKLENNDLIKNKRSNYNSKKIVDCCEICKSKENIESHHINPQASDTLKGKQKHKKANLVALCSKCHDDIHANPPRLIIEGYKQSTKGKILAFKKMNE